MKSVSGFFSRARLERSPTRLLRRLLRSQRGAASIEFVILAPVMIMIMLGFTEVYMYIRAVSIVEHTAFTLADSVGQMTSVINDPSTSNSNNIGSIFNAATLLAAPYDLKANGMVFVTSICDNNPNPCRDFSSSTPMASGTAVLYWQSKAPWTGSVLASQGSAETATSLLPATWPFRMGDSAIVIEVYLSYNPFTMTSNFWPTAPGTQIISRRVYVRPRSGNPLSRVPS